MTLLSDGAVVSMVKELTDRLSLVLLLSLVVTLIVQLSYVPSPRALKVIVVLLSLPTAEVLLLSQLPPYLIVPGRVE